MIRTSNVCHLVSYIHNRSQWMCSNLNSKVNQSISRQPPSLENKFHDNQPTASEEFLRVFTLYGHGSHLGHVTWTPRRNFHSPIPWMLNMKYDFSWLWFQRRCLKTLTDDRLKTTITEASHTISSPVSLWLRWAKKLQYTTLLGCPRFWPLAPWVHRCRMEDNPPIYPIPNMKSFLSVAAEI